MAADINHRRRRFIGVAAMTAAVAPLAVFGSARLLDAVGTPGALPSLRRATGWINSRPLTADGLRGKVVLIDFWTYTCINWLRTLPHVRAWSRKYADHGLVVIGVHTPEFEFEHSVDNVRRAVTEMGIEYPIAIDNDYAIWRAFRNAYWPALYFVDARGRIRHHHFGEGGYERSEGMVQQLLAEAGVGDVSRELVSVDAHGAEVAADWGNLRSPENYLGHARTENFASPGGVGHDKRRSYVVPARLRLNQWALSGDWTAGKQAIVLHEAHGRIVCRFHARDLHLVLASASHGRPVRFQIRIDGAPPGTDHGVDVDAEGWGSVREGRLYQLVRQTSPALDRTFEIEFGDAGVRAYAFTFG